MPKYGALGKGHKLEFQRATPNTRVEIVGAQNYTAPGVTREEVDCSWIGGPNKEFMAGDVEYTDLQTTINLVPGNVVDVLCETLADSGEDINIYIVQPGVGANTITKGYVGYVKSYTAKNNGRGALLTADIAVRINGKIVP